jgi:Tfp pilus assembly protein PilX
MEKKLFFQKNYHLGNERGAVLIVGLLIVLVLTTLSLAAMMSTATELKIAVNDRSSKEAFYLGEAGLEDARSRFQASSPYPIYDNHPTNTSWTAFIGSEEECQEKGYQSMNGNHVRYERLNPPNLNYVVSISHKVDASNNILKWGDSNNDGRPEENTAVGNNIYVITSEGYTATGARKPVRIEAAKPTRVTAPAALYTKSDTTIQGSSTFVNGNGTGACGLSSVPGIITMASVRQNGGPSITGSPSAIVEHSDINIDVQSIIDGFKRKAAYHYDQPSTTYTGMSWGTPSTGATQQDPTSCGEQNIVWFDTKSTYVKLSGGSSGCGILMVEGDLSVQGGFQWYGVVLVTGSITFTGGGGKNVTGAMLAGGTVSADLVGGDANVIYCSRAVDDQTDNMPLLTLRWAEIFS